MKTTNTKWLAMAGFAFAAAVFISWKKPDSQLPVKHLAFAPFQDTTLPDKNFKTKKEYKVGELDQAMKELDNAMVDMDKNLKIDLSKMNKELKLAMEEIKKVDWEKINQEIKTAIKSIDWDKTKLEIDKAIKEAEFQTKAVNKEQIEKQIAQAKLNLEKAKLNSKIDIADMKRKVEKSMEGAKVSIEKAKRELNQLKEFTEALEKDGLISKKKGYKLEIKNGELYINGTKQSQEVNDKYRKYFKEEDYSISSDGEEISSI